jgi:ubiquinone/menaquinone biosynthesis C-methylase UbiE
MVTHHASLRDDSQDSAVRAAFNHPKSYAALYDGVSFQAYMFQERIRLVLDLIREGEGGKVLDVGCGPGMMARRLIDRNWKVFGLDMSPEMVRECRDGLGRSDRAAFLIGRLESLPFKDGSFDAVLGMGVLEYVADTQAALRELARVTRPGGALVVTMLNWTSPWIICHRPCNWIRFFRHKLMGQPVNPPPHLKLHSERGLRKQIESAGLSPLDVIFYWFNLFPRPLALHMPRRAIRISSRIDTLLRNHLRCLRGAFMVKARKQ